MPFSRPASLCLVGVGPRGVSIVERLAANTALLSPGEPWVLHLVDDAELGAGRIWRTDQTLDLCMNTLAGAVTLFTDSFVTMSGPVVDGPNLYEWCLLAVNALRGMRSDEVEQIAPVRRSVFGTVDLPPVLFERPQLVDEMALVRPESHPSRVLYGAYSTWVLAYALSALPAEVTVLRHDARATSVRLVDGSPVVQLDSGQTLAVDDVILSLGWLARQNTAADAELARLTTGDDRFVWVGPDSPIDQDLSAVPAGESVIVRGLGMGFFDTMMLLTQGRGGRFVPGSDGLSYEPSGREPVLHVTSRRGVPFRAKSLYGALPPAAQLSRLLAFRASAVIDFDSDLWPRIVLDAHEAWYRTLHQLRPEAFRVPLDVVISALDAGTLDTLDGRLTALVPVSTDRFDLAVAMNPASASFDSPAAFDTWVADYLSADLHESGLGVASELKAALWVFGSARKTVSKLLAFDGTTADSFAGRAHRDFLAFGGMVGSGPPAFRSAQLLALAQAGIVHFIGPGSTLRVSAGAFVAQSPRVHGSEVRAHVLIDAWMHSHDVTVTNDPVIAGLSASGVLRAHHRISRAGIDVADGGVDIEQITSRLIDAEGVASRNVHLVGIPVSDTRGDTVISPMPRADATFLRETDGVARAALQTLAAVAVRSYV
ncbi:FAD/NAD(P)-binding domain-containing protein [Cryobacterium sp. Y11]|uniref:FAD/NAD(P)-binding protein n=1 Tax=Cryobacterium sp. Y11 TaxID=2045016 RepID=UPI000CE311B0|nr:FAD/NAD(P)-binding protein [Cryobacterium sp. Y11]